MSIDTNNRAGRYVATLTARLTRRAATAKAERATERQAAERRATAAVERAAGLAYQTGLDAHRANASVRRVRAELGLDMPTRRPVTR